MRPEIPHFESHLKIPEDYLRFSPPGLTNKSDKHTLTITSTLDGEYATDRKINIEWLRQQFLQIRKEWGMIYQPIEFRNFQFDTVTDNAYSGTYEARHRVFESEFAPFSLKMINEGPSSFSLHSRLMEAIKESLFTEFYTRYKVFINEKSEVCCKCDVEFALSDTGKKAGTATVSAVVKQAFSKLWRKLLAPETFEFEKKLRANYIAKQGILATYQDYPVNHMTLLDLLKSQLCNLHPRIKPSDTSNQIIFPLLIAGTEETIEFIISAESNRILLQANSANNHFSKTSLTTRAMLEKITMQFSIIANGDCSVCKSEFSVTFGRVGNFTSSALNLFSGGKVNVAINEGLNTLMITMMRRLSQLASLKLETQRTTQEPVPAPALTM